MKNLKYLGNGVKIFHAQGICRLYYQLVPKIVFSPFVAAILNFYVKRKNALISEMVRDRAIFDKIFNAQDICRLYCQLVPKIVFSPFLAAILNFCVKRKMHLSQKWCEKEQFLTKFLTRRVSADSTVSLSQKSFSRHFWQPS